MIEIIVVFLILIGGVALIIFSSSFAVKNSALLATALGISPLIIGVTLVSIGTDISEIFNSIISCSLGHGDIDVGDSVGSDLTQLTLVFGLLPLICGSFHVNRKDIIILGSCEVLSLLLIFTIVEKGYITRLNALFMVFSLAIYFWLIYNANKESILHRVELIETTQPTKSKKILLLFAAIGFIGVTIGSYVIVNSVIYISQALSNALRHGHHSIAIGDIVGSCIVDSTLSIGIGQVFFPQAVTAELAVPTVLYTLVVSIIVIVVVAVRQKMDKKSGVFFIFLYIMAFVFLFGLGM